MNPKDKDVKDFMGLPMRWNSKKMFSQLWNPEDDRLFPPKQFGIGWTINFHALFKEMGLIKSGKKNDEGQGK